MVTIIIGALVLFLSIVVATTYVEFIEKMWCGYFWRPSLKTIQQITADEPLLLHTAASSSTEISVWVSGTTFLYQYTRERADNTVLIKLTVKFSKKVVWRQKNVLTIHFINDVVRKWTGVGQSAEEKNRDQLTYEDCYRMRAILQAVENATPFRRINEIA